MQFKHHLRDQRGVAMVLELVLVAVVLGIVGLAVYHASHRPKNTTATQTSVAPDSAEGLANAAAAAAEVESNTEAGISAAAETAANELDEADADMADLGDSVDANAL